MYGLGLSNGVCNRDGSRVESHDLGLESNCQRATAPRSQAYTTIICFRVVASDRIACEIYRRCLRVAGIVEQGNCQWSTRLAWPTAWFLKSNPAPGDILRGLGIFAVNSTGKRPLSISQSDVVVLVHCRVFNSRK